MTAQKHPPAIRSGDIIRCERDFFGQVEIEEFAVLEVKGPCDECQKDAVLSGEDPGDYCNLGDGFFHLRARKIGWDSGVETWLPCIRIRDGVWRNGADAPAVVVGSAAGVQLNLLEGL